MIEKLLLIFVIIEAINVTHSIVKSVMDIISTRNLTKAQNAVLNGQQEAIKIQDEQLKLSKFYSERQNEQNENIRQLAFIITEHGKRLTNLEDHMLKTMPKEKAKKTVKKPVAKKTKETK